MFPANSTNLNDYLQNTRVAESGFNYHLISVFGSQSTGKSTLLNNLFGTEFSVMSETERRQTTKGIWMSKNKRKESAGAKMADNILVMDVEGTDGRERGEDQDFERKSALFALATSEVLIINIWEHQVGLYQGANMGLLKTVFEVNLQLFLRDKQYDITLALFPFFICCRQLLARGRKKCPAFLKRMKLIDTCLSAGRHHDRFSSSSSETTLAPRPCPTSARP